MKAFKFYSDAGHGWLAVKRKTLKDLDILDKITGYSYQRGQTVYLEEDCDLSTFIKALREKGIEIEYKRGSYAERSPIRSYDSFQIA